MYWIYILSTVLMLSLPLKAQVPIAMKLEGVWLSPKEDIKIRIFEQAEKYYGQIIWIKSGASYGKFQYDVKNPDPDKRSRSLIGLTILRGFSYNPQKMDWRMGKIYHPKYGKIFRGSMSLENVDRLKIKGYWGVFHDSGIWTRVN